MKEMKNLPERMIPDRDNQVYYDTEKEQFYMIKWETGYYDTAHRIYFDVPKNKINFETGPR